MIKSAYMALLSIGVLTMSASLANAVEAENGRNLNGRNLNGMSLNGRNLNGANLNGRNLNGSQAQGSVSSLDGAAPTAVVLQDGTVVPLR